MEKASVVKSWGNLWLHKLERSLLIPFNLPMALVNLQKEVWFIPQTLFLGNHLYRVEF
jgi:hypothetical protein